MNRSAIWLSNYPPCSPFSSFHKVTFSTKETICHKLTLHEPQVQSTEYKKDEILSQTHLNAFPQLTSVNPPPRTPFWTWRIVWKCKQREWRSCTGELPADSGLDSRQKDKLLPQAELCRKLGIHKRSLHRSFLFRLTNQVHN